MKVQLRVRGPDGIARLEVEGDATMGQLVELIKDKTNVSTFTLKYGYPLKDLDLNPQTEDKTVSDFRLHGETLIIVPLEASSAGPAPAPQMPATEPQATEPGSAVFEPKSVEPDETVLAWPERRGSLGMAPSIPPSVLF
jgi:ubiquitin thioesterase OTU1